MTVRFANFKFQILAEQLERSSEMSSSGGCTKKMLSADKENSVPPLFINGDNVCDRGSEKKKKVKKNLGSLKKALDLDPVVEGLKLWELSDNEAAPASSWSTLNNRSLLCKPLPLDIGRCTCIIVKEKVDGLKGLVSLYSLYTSEGQGRQNRKLAVAWHRRRCNGRSEFFLALNPNGILSRSEDNFLGSITSNLMGSKYQIWDQGKSCESPKRRRVNLLGVVAFAPTISTWMGNFRRIRAWLPKHDQSLQPKNTTQIHHIKGLPKDWELKTTKSQKLFSKPPFYNKVQKRYELDFRERGAGRTGLLRIQPSVKNFQLSTGENGNQLILQLGKISISKYVMDFRYPLTGYQAFCICLSSIDSKLCCAV